MCLEFEWNHFGSIPAGGPIVEEFFSTVPGWYYMVLKKMPHFQLLVKSMFHQSAVQSLF